MPQPMLYLCRIYSAGKTMEIKHVDRRIAVLLIAGICAVLFMYGAYGSVPEVEQLIIRALPSMPRDMDGYLAVFFSGMDH